MYNLLTHKYSREIYIVKSITGTLADEIKAQQMKNRYPHGKPPPMRTALDDLLSAERKENQASSDLYSDSEDNNEVNGNESESLGNGTRFAHRTGVFSLDFPESPKVPKGRGKKKLAKKARVMAARQPIDSSESDVPSIMPTKQLQVAMKKLKQRESDITTTDSKCTTLMPTQTQELQVTNGNVQNSDSDFLIQPSGFITDRRKWKRSSSSRREDKRTKFDNRTDARNKKGGCL